MAKVKINSLPEGFEIRNGKVIQTMSRGGFITGDQMTNGSYGLVTIPTSADGSELGGLPSMPSIRYSLAPVPRDEANIEAEKGETVLTDLDEDGNFELYDIGGNRHGGGGTPLNLPPQSFIFSDTAKARFNKGQLADLGITSKKKMTPAKASKYFELNPYIGALADPHSDKITDLSAELMLDKNKHSLSHIALMQEERKKFKEGVPLAAHPYLTSQGVNPIEFSMQVEEINRKEAEDAAIAQLPPDQQQKMMMLRQFMEQTEAQQAQQDEEMGMEPPPPQEQQQQQMQPPPGMGQGMAQGMPPQGMGQQGMAPPQMAPPQMPPPQMMGKYGGQPCYDCGGEHRGPLRKAQEGTGNIPEFSEWAAEYAQTPEFQALLESGEVTMETANDYLTQMWTQMYDAEFNPVDDDYNNYAMEYINTPEGQALLQEAVASGLTDPNEIQAYMEEKIKPIYDQYATQLEEDQNLQTIEPLPPAIIENDMREASVQDVEPPIITEDPTYAYDTLPYMDASPLEREQIEDPDMVDLEIEDSTIPDPEPEVLETSMIEDPDNPGNMIEGTKEEAAEYYNYSQSGTGPSSSFADWRITQQTGDVEDITLVDNKEANAPDVDEYLTVQDDIDIKAPIDDKEKLAAMTAEDEDYIDKIINYELTHGDQYGKPLTIAQAFKLPVGATKDDARKKIETEYLPGYENYPPGLKERVVDFHVNSEDPRGSLMVAAALLTPAQKVALYYKRDEINDIVRNAGFNTDIDPSVKTDDNASAEDKQAYAEYEAEYNKYAGKFNPTRLDPAWTQHQKGVEALINTPEFIGNFDAEKHRSYKNSALINGKTNPAYGLSWGPRVDMWTEGFEYDKWTPGQYYTQQTNGTYKPTVTPPTKDGDKIITTPPTVADSQPVVTIEQEPVKVKATPDWEKGYDKYKEYWNGDTNKALRDAAYGAYTQRTREHGIPAKSQDEFNALWLREQRQKRYFGSLPEDQVSGEDWDNKYVGGVKKGDSNWRYRQEIAAANADLGFTALTNDEIGHTQLAFQGLKDVHNLSEGDPLLEKMFKGSYLYHGGKKDEGYAGYKDITDIDYLGGNTWNRQYHDLSPVEEPEVEKIIEKEETVYDITQPVVGREAELPRKDFWLQDILGTANAVSNKFRVNKYYPWAPMINKPRMQPVFDDPTRRIAAINEQKTIADQARAMYSGPQSLAAFTGKSSGQALKGVADLVDRVNRYNVDTANKFEGLNANMDFMTQRLNNSTRTKLYNDTMLTEQNYDNAMAQADMAITRQLQNAFTNRANTYNMNTLYDQYNVNPMSGGMIDFTNPRDPYATDNRGQTDRERQYFDFMQRHSKLYPDQTTSPFPAFKWIQGQNQPNMGYNPQQQQMMQMMQGSPYGVPNVYNQGSQQNWNNQYVQPYGY